MSSDPHAVEKCSPQTRNRFVSASRKKRSGKMNRRLEDNSTSYSRLGVKPETCGERFQDKERLSNLSECRLVVEPGTSESGDREDEESMMSELGGEDAKGTLLEKGSRLCASQSEHKETLVAMIVQIVLPFFLAGFGMMAAGLLLDTVQVSGHH